MPRVNYDIGLAFSLASPHIALPLDMPHKCLSFAPIIGVHVARHYRSLPTAMTMYKMLSCLFHLYFI